LTRDEILRAARQLFAQRGYARTSVRDVAKAAGVSVQTVYDSIGSKQALVGRLNDVIDHEAGIAEIARAAAASSDPYEVAGTSARITRSILEHCGDVIHALVTGAAAEPELARVLAEGQRRHVEGAGQVIARLHTLGALAATLDRRDAVDTLAAISDVRVAVVLRESYGWSLERIESWVGTASRTLLLVSPPTSPARGRRTPRGASSAQPPRL
jgi:AcrR family transcriptional regulator